MDKLRVLPLENMCIQSLTGPYSLLSRSRPKGAPAFHLVSTLQPTPASTSTNVPHLNIVPTVRSTKQNSTDSGTLYKRRPLWPSRLTCRR